MKYRTRKLIKNTIDTVCLVLMVFLLVFIFLSVRKVSVGSWRVIRDPCSISTTRKYTAPLKASRFLFRRIMKVLDSGKRRRVLLSRVTSHSVVQKEHAVFLNDLEYGGVDSLSDSLSESHKADASEFKEGKVYSYDKRSLSPSTPLSVIDYFDPSFDYIESDKKYRDLLTEVNKELEYKSEKKGDGGKKKGRWGSKSKKAEERASMRASETVNNGIAETIGRGPFVFDGKTMAELHAATLAQMATAPDNGASKKVVHLTESGESVGRSAPRLEGAWSDPVQLKLYVVPLGVYLPNQFSVGVERCREF